VIRPTNHPPVGCTQPQRRLIHFTPELFSRQDALSRRLCMWVLGFDSIVAASPKVFKGRRGYNVSNLSNPRVAAQFPVSALIVPFLNSVTITPGNCSLHNEPCEQEVMLPTNRVCCVLHRRRPDSVVAAVIHHGCKCIQTTRTPRISTTCCGNTA
jgi:hypothetical protein